MIIAIDTREQRPLDFSAFPKVRTKRATVWPGDYALVGAPRLVAVERKSVSDLVGTMRGGYAGYATLTPKRFDCELMAMRGFPFAHLVVEPDAPDVIRRCGGRGDEGAAEQIAGGHYRAMIPPLCVIAFLRSIRGAWRVEPILCASRAEAAAEVVRVMRAADALRAAMRDGAWW